MKSKNAKRIIAARVLVDQVPSAKALSHGEKRVVTQVLAQTPDGELPVITSKEAEEVATKPQVRDAIVEALARIGVNTDTIAATLADGLKADDHRYFASFGLVQDERIVPDHNTRHKFLETTMKLIGATPKTDAPVGNVGVFVFRSHLGEKPVEVQVGAPTDEIVKRRMKAAKVSNRNYA